MSEDKNQRPPVSKLDEMVNETLGQGGVIGNYVIVAEVIYDDGIDLQFALSDGMPPWLAKGMLMSILESFGAAPPDMWEDEPPSEEWEPPN